MAMGGAPLIALLTAAITATVPGVGAPTARADDSCLAAHTLVDTWSPPRGSGLLQAYVGERGSSFSLRLDANTTTELGPWRQPGLSNVTSSDPNVSESNETQRQLGPWNATSTDPNVSNATVTQVLCWSPPAENLTVRPVWVMPETVCPEECPFSQRLENEPCYKACVRPEHCKALHPFRVYPDLSSLECAPVCGIDPKNSVVGCSECASPGICKRCSFWRNLENEGRTCTDYWQYLWLAVYATCVVAVILFIVFMIHLQLRPTHDAALLACAMMHRELCRPFVPEPRNASTDSNVEDAFVSTAPARRPSLLTRTQAEDVCGLGVMLYFRWMCFLGVVAFLLLIIFAFAFHVAPEVLVPAVEGRGSGHSIFEEAGCPWNNTVAGLLEENMWRKPKVRSVKKFKIKAKVKPRVRPKLATSRDNSDGDRPAGDPEFIPKRMAVAAMASYVMVFVLSLEFSRRQKRFAVRWGAGHKSHADYMVMASGLPKEATSPTELQRFFQQALDSAPAIKGREPPEVDNLCVVGVSIAYDYLEQQDVINKSFDLLVERISEKTFLKGGFVEASQDKSRGGVLESESVPCPSEETTAEQSTEVEASGDEHKDTRRDPFRLVRVVMSPVANVFTLVTSIRTGNIFIMQAEDTTGWEEEACAALNSIQGSGYAYVIVSSELARERLLMHMQELNFGGQLLSLTSCPVEPPAVRWVAHGLCRSPERIMYAGVALVGTIALWTAFYVPYAMYHMTAEAVPGHEVGKFADTALGLLIAFGNQLVTLVIEATTEKLGFLHADERNKVTMILVYLATVVNTVCDVAIVLIVMMGISANFSLYGTLDQSHYQRVLAQELYALIVPGYLITPYLFAPIFEDLVPYFISSRLVRSSWPSVRYAERKLMCPEFDISLRYADLLTNFTICLALLMFESTSMYMIMLWLLICVLLLYGLDHYRLLRMTSVTWQLTEELSATFAYCWAVPTGLLGIIGVHWMIEARWLRPSRGTLKLYLMAFALFHAIAYTSLLYMIRCSVTLTESCSTSYTEMCNEHWKDMRPYTYFNMNPVQVLRSWFLPEPEDERERKPYVIGKEYFSVPEVWEPREQVDDHAHGGAEEEKPSTGIAITGVRSRLVAARASVAGHHLHS